MEIALNTIIGTSQILFIDYLHLCFPTHHHRYVNPGPRIPLTSEELAGSDHAAMRDNTFHRLARLSVPRVHQIRDERR
jgi:hypothetical protein